MKKYVIGLMSGTSLDGLDICYAEFDMDNLKNFRILAAETISYSLDLSKKIKNIYTDKALELVTLDKELGIYYGKLVNEFIKKNHINKVDLIASHGQTIFHNPQQAYTTQIGNAAHINAITKIKTIADFRYQDVALGGEGAPLVPIGDLLLFPEFTYCLNLGGFANISVKKEKAIKAFDLCPANIVLNHYVQKTGIEYDDRGKMAATGKIHAGLLSALNSMEEYKEAIPKSFGWEIVEQKVIPLIDSFSISIPDILRTYTEHIAMQIAAQTDSGKMLITGGGAYNDFLIERIKQLSTSQVIIPDSLLVDFKEALIFGLLGLLKEQGKNNILSSVTGAEMDHSSGIIYDAFKNIN